MTVLEAPVGWVVVAAGLRLFGFAAGDVCGLVNSSMKSANRGWCIWIYVAEESLL